MPDVHLITLRPGLVGLIVPSKYYGIAAAGRPAIFIGDPEGEIGRILGSTGTGLVVDEGDDAALARAIMSLAGYRRLADNMGGGRCSRRDSTSHSPSRPGTTRSDR